MTRDRLRTLARRPRLEPLEGRQLLAASPYITVGSPKITEGTGTTSYASFSVNLTAAATAPVTMDYRTVAKTALAGSDYVESSGTLTFAPGERSRTISVAVIGDAQVELTEVFGLQLSNARNGVLVGSMGIATIMDDDAAVAPELTVKDVQMTRGLDGSRTMVFAVTLNRGLATPVTVNVATADVTALAGRDYAAVSESLTFAPGETTKFVSVTIYGTEAPTSDKIVFLNLSAANVALARTTAAGVIKYGA